MSISKRPGNRFARNPPTEMYRNTPKSKTPEQVCPKTNLNCSRIAVKSTSDKSVARNSTWNAVEIQMPELAVKCTEIFIDRKHQNKFTGKPLTNVVKRANKKTLHQLSPEPHKPHYSISDQISRRSHRDTHQP